MFKFFNKQTLDSATLEQIEEELILADIGPKLTSYVIDKLKKHTKAISIEDLKNEVISILKTHTKDYHADRLFINHIPFVILVSGTNGSGKTTTIAKLANYFKKLNLSVLVAPCDTFRAGAEKQLTLWAQKLSVDIVNSNDIKDPAAVAYKALEMALANKHEVVIIDTAGRLESNLNLMNELKKIEAIIKKLIPQAPHESILILDGTLGQTSYTQALAFAKFIKISGLIVTKMDSQAKGGFLLNIMNTLAVPIYFLGMGEKENDLTPFDLDNFLTSLIS